MDEKKNDLGEDRKIENAAEDKQKPEGWEKDENFTLQNILLGIPVMAKKRYKNNVIEFRSLSSAEVDDIGMPYNLMRFSDSRKFNRDMLARSIVSINNQPLPCGDSLEKRVEWISNLPDAMFDLLVMLYSEFKFLLQAEMTEEKLVNF